MQYKTHITYRILRFRRADYSCDVFIVGVDDFKPIDCNTEAEAEHKIMFELEGGQFYIQKIYCKNYIANKTEKISE